MLADVCAHATKCHLSVVNHFFLQVVGDDGSVSFHSLCLLHLLPFIHISWAVKREFFI